MRKNKMKTRELAANFGIGYDMFRQIINKNKPTKNRDLIIKIGLALDCNTIEINELLHAYDMPRLDFTWKHDIDLYEGGMQV